MTVLADGFALASAGALVAGLYSAYASVRAALGVSSELDTHRNVEALEVASLRDQREALLQTLADLRFDHEAGKVSDKDFERLDRRLRKELGGVMKRIDTDLEPFRDEARKQLTDAMGGEGSPYRTNAGEGDETEANVSSDVQICSECRQENDADAKFCKACATPLGVASASNSEPPAQTKEEPEEKQGEEE